MLMEAYPKQAILVEKITGCEFSFLANAYATHDQFAFALGCKRREIGDRATRRRPDPTENRRHGALQRSDPQGRRRQFIAPAAFPPPRARRARLYQRQSGRDQRSGHERDRLGHLPLDVPYDQRKELRHDLYQSSRTAPCSEAPSSRAEHAGRDRARRPTLNKLAALAGVPPGTEDFEVLGSFYGRPARLVKCETNDLLVPANAEIVLEGEVITTEGWVHDEGPYGEFTGMYGGGLKHNPRVIIDCMTYRKGGIYQHATVGAAHPGYTDNMIQLPAIESDLFNGLQQGGINVLDVRCPLSPTREQSRRAAATPSRPSPLC